jgi:hypothetical protein
MHVLWFLLRRSIYFLNICIIRVFYHFNRNRALQPFSRSDVETPVEILKDSSSFIFLASCTEVSAFVDLKGFYLTCKSVMSRATFDSPFFEDFFFLAADLGVFSFLGLVGGTIEKGSITLGTEGSVFC